MNPVYIVDNSNFCYKFKDVHKYAHVVVNGVPVSTAVLTGYIRAIKSNIFENIIIVLDGVPKKSLELLPSYKGQRMHDELSGISVPKIEVIQFLSSCGPLFHKNVQVVCSPGQEADQVVSSLVHIITNNLPLRHSLISSLNTVDISSDRMLKYLNVPTLQQSKFTGTFDEVVIGSTDADMAQLQRFPNVFIDQSTSGKKLSSTVTADSVSQVRPELIPLYKAIYGDSSDNVPALPINAKRPEVLKYIDTHFRNFDDVKKFVTNVASGINEHWWSTLYSLVYPFRKEFSRNYAITCLEFYSVPTVLTFSEYSIEDTIKKYRLRV